MVARDIALLARTGGRLHIAHLSTAGAVDLVRDAKRRGPGRHRRGHAAPLHPDGGGRRRLQHERQDEPAAAHRPRRGRRPRRPGRRNDRRHRDGPRAAPSRREGSRVRPGGQRHRRVGNRARLTLRLARRGADPARRAGRGADRQSGAHPAASRAARLTAGCAADVTIIDPARRWTVEATRFQSKSRNTPFGGLEMRGQAVADHRRRSGRVVRRSVRRPRKATRA